MRYIRGLSVSGQTMLLSLILAVVAFVLSMSQPTIATVVTLTAVGLFVYAYITALSGTEKYRLRASLARAGD